MKGVIALSNLSNVYYMETSIQTPENFFSGHEKKPEAQLEQKGGRDDKLISTSLISCHVKISQ